MSCCVCRSNLDTIKGKKKHKKLNGISFTSEKATLAKCLNETYALTLEMVGLNKPSCTVCYECNMKLNKIMKLETQIKMLKNELTEKFSAIVDAPQCSGTADIPETANVLRCSQTPRRYDQQRYLHQPPPNNAKRRKVIVSINTM